MANPSRPPTPQRDLITRRMLGTFGLPEPLVRAEVDAAWEQVECTDGSRAELVERLVRHRLAARPPQR